MEKTTHNRQSHCSKADVQCRRLLNLHAGHRRVKDSSGGASNSQFSYTGWKVGVVKDYDILTSSAAPIGTTSDTYRGPNGENLGKNSLVVTGGKIFLVIEHATQHPCSTIKGLLFAHEGSSSR